MPPESGKSALIVQPLPPVTYLASPTYSADTYETPSRVMTTKRISWILVLRLSIAASLPRADQHGRKLGRRRAVGLLLRPRGGRALGVDRARQAAEDLVQRWRHDPAELVGEAQVEHRVEVRVVT